MEKRIRKIGGILLLLGNLVCLTHQAAGEVYNTWQGGTTGKETDWNTPGNWSMGKIPTMNDGCSIGIPGGTFQPVIKGKTEVNGKITLGDWNKQVSNAKLTITEGSTLDVYGNGVIENLFGTIDIEKGVVITFHPDKEPFNGGIYSRGSLFANGTKERPIIIQGSDAKHRIMSPLRWIVSVPGDPPDSCVINWVEAKDGYYGLLVMVGIPNHCSITNCSSTGSGPWGARISTEKGIFTMNNCSFARPILMGNVWKEGGEIYPHSKLELYNCQFDGGNPFFGFEGITDGWAISHGHNGIPDSYLVWAGPEGMNLIFDERGHVNPDEEDAVSIMRGVVHINKNCSVKRLTIEPNAKLVIDKDVTVKVNENLTNNGMLENNGKVAGELINKGN